MARKLKIWSVSAKSFRISLLVHGIKGLSVDDAKQGENYVIALQIKWKGPPNRVGCWWNSIPNTTAERSVQGDGSVNWEESFDHACRLKLLNARSFANWYIHIEIQCLSPDLSTPNLGNVTVDIAEFVIPNTSKRTIQIPVNCNLGGILVEAELSITLSLSEIQTKRNNSLKKRVLSLLFPPGSCRDLPQMENKAQVLIPQHRKPFETVHSNKKVDSELDTNDCKFTPEQSKKFSTTESSSSSSSSTSPDEPEFGYGNIAETNLLVEVQGKDREGNRVELLPKESLPPTTDHEVVRRPSLFSLLQWKNSSFRLSNRHKGMPLLNKERIHGGDDIDNDRRYQGNMQQGSTTESGNIQQQTGSPAWSGFDEDDCFVIGSWEKKQFVSRDGRWELETNIFLASRDQCSEKVGGEGACAVIVTVIADWLLRNPETLPLKCQFDKLIKEGSLEWRKLCENERHLERFSDKHFDLETVLAAKVRLLSVVSAYVGFFLPDDMNFDFLDGLKSFDSIWDEHVSNVGHEGGAIYIVSWNDHFFTIKVERDAIYLIDTLGERLHEGCNQAYILKFDNETTISELPPKLSKPNAESPPDESETSSINPGTSQDGELIVQEIMCQGRSSCKGFIKNFLAALPLRELQDDMQKGLITKEQMLRRLQIEFHSTAICD